MKKLIFLGIFILSISVIYSQPSKVQELFGKYGGKDGFTSVNLNDPSALLSDLDNQHKDEIKKEIGEINGIKILTYDASKQVNKKLGEEFAAELKKFIPDAGYKEFMSVNEGGSNVRMYTKKQGNTAGEFLMIVSQKSEESVLIWMSGAMNLNNVGKIGKMFEQFDEKKHNHKEGKKKEE